MADWTDDELRATVRAYLDMLTEQEAGRSYAKSAYRSDLIKGPLSARTGPSVEYRMRNISAVLSAHQRPMLRGYLPATNVGQAVRERIWRLVEEVDALTSPASPGQADVRPPMIYFNIGWMKEYRGTDPNEATVGGHRYLKEHQHGAESFNFADVDGRVRGYRPGHGYRTQIERLGAATAQPSIGGVLVVWMAREPLSGETRIVGWYQNATVYRAPRYPSKGGRTVNKDRVMISAEAETKDAHLLPIVARHFRVQSKRTSPDGFGQSPTWYGNEAVNARVWSYIRGIQTLSARKRPSSAKANRPPRNADPELRRKVEQAAVRHATEFYRSREGGRCEVTSVEALARGWDLEVVGGGQTLLVEVKGLQGREVVCELTPNEYEKMQHQDHQDRYVVYVVCNALTAPVASVFRLVGKDRWETQDGRCLEIIPRVAAVLREGRR